MDRQSNADIGQLAVIHYVGDKDLVKEGSEKTPSDKGSKTKSQPPSTLGESIAEEETMVDDASEHKSHVSFKDEAEIEDEFQKAVEGLEQVCRMGGITSAALIILFSSLQIYLQYIFILVSKEMTFFILRKSKSNKVLTF